MMRGRVGDSPIPGAGLFAGEKGAIVATGIGEEIMKRSLCYSIYHQIGTENLEDIIKREIDGFNGVLAGVIAITGDSYASYSNSSMAVGVYRFGNK
jgi:L-asparaginase/beta-aspartyl-peptidase (threonine type)